MPLLRIWPIAAKGLVTRLPPSVVSIQLPTRSSGAPWCGVPKNTMFFSLLRQAMPDCSARWQALRLTTHRGQPRRLGPVTLANVLVTVAFVALHLRAQPLAWALAVAAPSLVLGHLRERMGSVWPPVLVHMVYNAGFGLTAWLAGSMT